MLIIKSQNRKVIFRVKDLMIDKKDIYAYSDGCISSAATYGTEERAKKVFNTMNNLIERSVRSGKTMVYKIPIK